MGACGGAELIYLYLYSPGRILARLVLLQSRLMLSLQNKNKNQLRNKVPLSSEVQERHD